jgi:uncharacterized protein YdeI (YjbR/CyaY-like superfamily)
MSEPAPPEELIAALAANAEARAVYERLPPSHRREYDVWVHEAKKPETRERRVKRAIERLLQA